MDDYDEDLTVVTMLMVLIMNDSYDVADVHDDMMIMLMLTLMLSFGR